MNVSSIFIIFNYLVYLFLYLSIILFLGFFIFYKFLSLENFVTFLIKFINISIIIIIIIAFSVTCIERSFTNDLFTCKAYLKVSKPK